MNNIITFVTAFKKFTGVYDMIQKSALYSWQANDIRVLAPTNEVGVENNCKGFSNVTLLRDVKRAREIGFPNQSPIIPDLLEKAIEMTTTPLLALINSDIIIPSDFSVKIERIVEKYGFDAFMAAVRHDISLLYFVDSPEAYKKVLGEPRKIYDQSTSSDIFITSKFWWKKMLKTMPPFILGRYCWDNWIHSYAEVYIAKRFNCTDVIPILHCEHGHDHLFHQEKAHGKEAPSCQYNLKLWRPTLEVYGTAQVKYWKPIEV